ncbi:MAG: tyrosine-type recombinase/integrase, partial [Miltoncostaeaceae bacterium]
MASLIHEPERPRKPWRVDWTQRDGGRPTKRFRTKAEAQSWITHLRRGAAASDARMRLADWIERWMRTHGPGWAAKTLDERVWHCGRLIAPGLGAMAIGEITRPDVRVWRSDLLARGRTPKVINHSVRVLSAALGAAVNDDVLGANPCHGLRPLPEPPVDRDPATLVEVEALRAELEDPHDRLVVSLIAYAGLRPGELRRLAWRDVRPAALFVLRAADELGRAKTTKSGSTRTVPIRTPLAEDLEAVPRRGGGDLVVPRTTRWDNWTSRVWRPGRHRAEHEAPPYALRHTFASLSIAEGKTVFEVAALLGHSTPTLTMRTYGHLFAEAQIGEDQDMAAAALQAREQAPKSVRERAAAREG